MEEELKQKRYKRFENKRLDKVKPKKRIKRIYDEDEESGYEYMRRGTTKYIPRDYED